MREWYGLHFPEADKLVKSHEQLAAMIHRFGEREKFDDKHLQKYAAVSAGMPLSDRDIGVIQEYAKSITDLFRLRESVADYIKQSSREVIPNLSAVAGPLIACRLLSIAGGLERLAKMPSSTIQLLGAEKALFRHLRTKDRPPKFGVIFAHPAVQNAPYNEKGKVARLLASKLTMAARADFYTGKDMSEKLVSDFRDKMKKSSGQSHGHGRKKHGKGI
jgi:nucleolar protein 56